MSWLMTTLVTPSSPLGREDHLVHVVGGDGIQPRGGLVVEDDLRVQHDGARQAHALAHAAGQVRRELVLRRLRQAHQSPASRAPARGSPPRTARGARAGGTPRSRRRSSSRTGPRPGTPCRTCGAPAPAPGRPGGRCPRRRRCTWPWSGLSRPIMCFISTVLPEPEPPEDHAGAARGTVRLMPVSTWCSPKDLCRSMISIIGRARAARGRAISAGARRR